MTEFPSPAVLPRIDRGLAESLLPEVHAACPGSLGEVAWFRTDWQRGGATTGFAEYIDPDGRRIEAVLKLPVPGRELRWMRLQQKSGEPPVVPMLHASGHELGGYDIAWILIERLPGDPLGARWTPGLLTRTACAAARFQACAAGTTVDRPARRDDWEQLLERATTSLGANRLPDHERWVAAVEEASTFWSSLVARWRSRTPIGWVHGDLHLANAMARADDDRVVLIDLAEVRPGHWLEDALYLERLHWARPERLADDDPVEAMRVARAELGLDNGPDVEALAIARRLLLAATTPAFLKQEGTPSHLNACLTVLEHALDDWRASGC